MLRQVYIGNNVLADLSMKLKFPELKKNYTTMGEALRSARHRRKEAAFRVAMNGATEAEKYMYDKFIMSEIDFKDLRSTARLPYEMLVSGNKVYALYARYRIAISFPDLSMMGSNSFMKIMKSPEAIRKALTHAAGG